MVRVVMTDVEKVYGDGTHAVRAPYVAMHPIGRMGSVAEAAVRPAADASAFTTGSTPGVDGGFLA